MSYSRKLGTNSLGLHRPSITRTVLCPTDRMSVNACPFPDLLFRKISICLLPSTRDCRTVVHRRLGLYTQMRTILLSAPWDICRPNSDRVVKSSNSCRWKSVCLTLHAYLFMNYSCWWLVKLFIKTIADHDISPIRGFIEEYNLWTKNTEAEALTTTVESSVEQKNLQLRINPSKYWIIPEKIKRIKIMIYQLVPYFVPTLTFSLISYFYLPIFS